MNLREVRERGKGGYQPTLSEIEKLSSAVIMCGRCKGLNGQATHFIPKQTVE